MKQYSDRHGTFKIIPEARKVIGISYKRPFADEYYHLDSVSRMLVEYALTEVLVYFPWRDRKIVATAQCSLDDKWDEKTGVDICAEKIELKNHRSIARRLDCVIRILERSIHRIEELRDKHIKKAESIEEDLCKMYGRMPL